MNCIWNIELVWKFLKKIAPFGTMIIARVG